MDLDYAQMQLLVSDLRAALIRDEAEIAQLRYDLAVSEAKALSWRQVSESYGWHSKDESAGRTGEVSPPRYPSVACSLERFDRLLAWMKPGALYEKVDWEHATPEEMEQWRQEFARLEKLASAGRTEDLSARDRLFDRVNRVQVALDDAEQEGPERTAI